MDDLYMHYYVITGINIVLLLYYSGLDEFPHVTTDQIKLACKTLKEHEAKTGRSGKFHHNISQPSARYYLSVY